MRRCKHRAPRSLRSARCQSSCALCKQRLKFATVQYVCLQSNRPQIVRSNGRNTLQPSLTTKSCFSRAGESMNLDTLLRKSCLSASTALLVLAQGCAIPSATGPRPSEYAVAERVTIGGAGGWDFIAFDQVRQRLFISRGDRVQVWSVQSKRLVGEI